jgi:uncharacterized protein
MKNLQDFIDQLEQDITGDRATLPPVEKWHPPLSGDMDLVIRRNGDWVHEGTIIQRQALVKLFSSILKKEDDDYFLVTPVEKWRIQVEDAPFQVTALETIQRAGVQALVFTTATDDKVIAGPDHPLRVVTSDRGEPSPYLLVRHGMEGLINRTVFYQLADLAQQQDTKKAVPGVYSLGEFFPLQ